jgi:hypothetical protein
MYEVYLKKDGKEIFVGFFKTLTEIELLREQFSDNLIVYKVIGGFGGLNDE